MVRRSSGLSVLARRRRASTLPGSMLHPLASPRAQTVVRHQLIKKFERDAGHVQGMRLVVFELLAEAPGREDNLLGHIGPLVT